MDRKRRYSIWWPNGSIPYPPSQMRRFVRHFTISSNSAPMWSISHLLELTIHQLLPIKVLVLAVKISKIQVIMVHSLKAYHPLRRLVAQLIWWAVVVKVILLPAKIPSPFWKHRQLQAQVPQSSLTISKIFQRQHHLSFHHLKVKIRIQSTHLC